MADTWDAVRRERWLAVGCLALGLNSAYLAARSDPTLFYFSNIVLHVVLGLAVTAALVPLLRSRFSVLGPLLKAAALCLGAAVALGVFLMIFGATRPYRWALYAHIGSAGLAALLTLAHVLGRAAGSPRALDANQAMVAGACLALVAAPFARLHSDRDPQPLRPIINPALPPLSMEGEGAGTGSPFFPSSAETNTKGIIPANFFMTSKTCGRCHQDIYDQWNSSAHHFSSFNNQWYRKSIEYMQDVTGTTPSKWCAGCHDHAVFFNGRFDRPIRSQIDTAEAQNGLGCTSCHSIVHVKSTMGQGDFTIEYPPLHDLAVSENPVLAWGHDYLLKLDPRPHRQTFLKSFHTRQTPEFCSSCHKVHLDVPVNAYRWFRGFNEYDNWQASGISGEGARSFYYPARPQKCADCHMPLVASHDPAAREGQVHSHRFPAANTALPFVNRDQDQLKVTQDFLRDKQITVDVFGLVAGTGPEKGEERSVAGGEPRLASTFAVGEESLNAGAPRAVLAAPAPVIAPLDKVDPALRRGDSARVEVVVRTRKVGHFFPGGTVDAPDVWVELEAVDSNGKTIFHSGLMEEGGPVEPGAHFYRSLLLDEHGHPINKRNAWMARSVAYVRLIPPGAADTVHYRLRIPDDCGDRVTLKARVNYRKFSWWNTHWSFAGVRDPAQPAFSLTPSHDDGRWLFTGDTAQVSGQIKAIPDIPITVMASAEASLRILPRNAPPPAMKPLLDRSVRERWNDYGIGLLLQGDIKGAEAAFLGVTEMEPEYADGWVNVGRARVQEGNMAGAEEILRKALAVDPGLAKTHFFLGTVLKALGRYDEALGHLQAAGAQYPRDRVVRNQSGRVLFLKRRYGEAIAEFQKVLAIDPEDLQAHYNLMLCYQGLGDATMAKKEEALYQRFKADESAQFITGPYRQLHPEDNNERQQIHEHGSAAPRPAPSSYPLRPPSRTADAARGGK
ncbi:MAG TPA: tetratricopeptide repeat protein [Vicinamibacteria bacterium]|nr:tetratricopeptide repeat protein [Vicinamibacteria bacterium]